MSTSAETTSTASPASWTRWLPIGAVLSLSAVLSAFSTADAIRRYHEFRSGFPWDLAYYNQWFWALTLGDGRISVATFSAYAVEGPSIWHANYLALGRLFVAPIYWLWPRPETLLVVHGVVFWWVLPAAYTLVKAETKSAWLGLVAAGLTALTPLLWPLAVNDFREIQMGLPFVLWCVQGIRGRDVRLTAFGAAGMLLARQEFAPMLASFALIPAREPEDMSRTYRWAHSLLLLGMGWFLFGFFGYLSQFVSPHAPELYLHQFGGSQARLGQVVETATETLLMGLGSWAVFLVFVPRMRLLVLPWIYSISGGRWAMWVLATGTWHHVRWTAPVVAAGLATGLIGFAGLANRLQGSPRGRLKLGGVVLVAAAFSGLAMERELDLFSQQPATITPEEARDAWRWIGEVAPDDGVVSCILVSAHLSNRPHLYSYTLMAYRPVHYPVLAPDVRWIFWRKRDGSPAEFASQGFTVVHDGLVLTILRRAEGSLAVAAPGG